MTGKVDKFLLFSNIYEKCFKLEGVGPVSFKLTGYSYAYAYLWLCSEQTIKAMIKKP